jgi:hypothetical protein
MSSMLPAGGCAVHCIHPVHPALGGAIQRSLLTPGDHRICQSEHVECDECSPSVSVFDIDSSALTAACQYPGTYLRACNH